MNTKCNTLHMLSTYNTRDLGGYPCQDGMVTLYNVFYRSDRLDQAVSEDISVFKNRNISLVIDLRSDYEAEVYPDTAIIDSDIPYVHINMMGELEFKRSLDSFSPAAFKESYIRMTEDKQKINELMTLIANAEGPVLFHCTGGQDRTGITALLLLMTAHVRRCDIVNDYLITSTYLRNDKRLSAFIPDNLKGIELKTNPENILAVYDHIVTQYQTIENYFLSCGLSPDISESIRKKFTKPLTANCDMRRLPLEYGYNTRDLGGYCTDKGVTQFHRFIRSSDISRLTKQDLDFLYDYGVRTVIDLRSPYERELARDASLSDSRFETVFYPFMTSDMPADATKANTEAIRNFTLGDFYIGLVKEHDLVKGLLQLIASKQSGILFHCSAGKDRTGVTAMLLMAIAGCAEDDILTDYQRTFYYLIEDPQVKPMLQQDTMHLMHSDLKDIEKVYRYIIDTYGSFQSYFNIIGLSKEELHDIKKQLNAVFKIDSLICQSN